VVGVLVVLGLCGDCTVSTQDCVVGVLIDPGLCDGCTVSTQNLWLEYWLS